MSLVAFGSCCHFVAAGAGAAPDAVTIVVGMADAIFAFILVLIYEMVIVVNKQPNIVGQ